LIQITPKFQEGFDGVCRLYNGMCLTFAKPKNVS
jgi:hypothetical protein